jgi:tetratricopeptide (TPR) repeat protein
MPIADGQDDVAGSRPARRGRKRAWRLLLLLAAAAGGAGWWNYTKSPNGRADRQLAAAARLAGARKYSAAAERYRAVAVGPSDRARAAVTGLKTIIKGALDQAPPAEAAAVLRNACTLEERGEWLDSADSLVERGLSLAKHASTEDPRGALAILDAVAPLAPQADPALGLRRALLEQIIRANPDNPEPAAQLAEVYEKQADLETCRALLEPHRHRLADTEGARILGQIDVSRGRNFEAIPLLAAYTKPRLERLAATEKAYDKALKAAQERAVSLLQRGLAPRFDYEVYKQASESDQEVLVRRSVDRVLAVDPVLKEREAQLIRDARVVPAALDLGAALFQRALKLAEPHARREGMEQAEQTFLAVRGLAGRSDEYRLRLGQVYYWLEKHAEGRKLFDELLAQRKRDLKTLAAVALALREVGAGAEARRLFEEAYARATEPPRKYEMAQYVGVSASRLEESIQWLERADPGNLQTQAMLASARGRKARADGNHREAVTELSRAAGLYRHMKADAGVLNNGALVHFELFALEGNRAEYDQAVAMIDRAVALDPGDSILVGNAARRILEAALRGVIGDALDLRILDREASIELLEFLYRDAADRAELHRRLRADPGIARALSLLEKEVLLAPQREGAYSLLTALAEFLGDGERLRALARKLETVPLDQQEHRMEVSEFYGGKSDAKYRPEVSTLVSRTEAAYHNARSSNPGHTLAAAAALHAKGKLLGTRVGVDTDPDAVVALAEEAHAAAPSQGTRAVLIAALLHRAGTNAAKHDPEFAELAACCRRELDPGVLLAARIVQGDSPCEGPRRDSDVMRSAALIQDTATSIPEAPSPLEWALLAATRPEHGNVARQALFRVESEFVESIRLRLDPWNLGTALNAWCRLRLLDRPVDADLVIRRCAGRGVPLPYDPR